MADGRPLAVSTRLILLGRFSGSYQIAQSFVSRVRHPDRREISRSIASGQLHSVPPIRLHPVADFDRNQGRSDHFTLHSQTRQLPIQYISRRAGLVTGLQLLGWAQLLDQLAYRLFSIWNRT